MPEIPAGRMLKVMPGHVACERPLCNVLSDRLGSGLIALITGLREVLDVLDGSLSIYQIHRLAESSSDD